MTLASAKAAPAPTPEPIVELPPLIVVEKMDPLRWRYVAVPGLEAIAVCSDDAAAALVQRHVRLQELLQLVLPARLQPQWSVPEKYVFFNEQIDRLAGQEVVTDIVGVKGEVARRVRFTPNLRMADVDAHAVFVVVREHRTQAGIAEGLYFARERVAALLQAKAPPLPAWFVAGTLGLYDTAQFGDDTVTIRGAQWISEEEDAALRRDPDRPRLLLPMAELLAGPAPDGDGENGERARIWRAQCALFVRWAVAHEAGARKEALWRFAERTVHAPPTEALLREHFGLGLADLRDRLSDYLPAALAETIELRPAALARPPPLRPRPATRAEIARIRGDWERMQIRYVRARYPELASKYVDQALGTLRRAQAAGEREPELLAVLGLAELEAGNANTAEGHLLAAARGGVARPRVWFELARLRFSRDREQAAAGDGKLSVVQTADLLALLEKARALQPPLAMVYGLMNDVWLLAGTAPSPAELARLEEGARLFPRNSALMMSTIHLHARARRMEPVPGLIALGEWHAIDAATREKFLRLAQTRPVTPGAPD